MDLSQDMERAGEFANRLYGWEFTQNKKQPKTNSFERGRVIGPWQRGKQSRVMVTHIGNPLHPEKK